MDGGGCLAEPMSGPGGPASATARRARAARGGSMRRVLPHAQRFGAFTRRLDAHANRLARLRPPRGVGVAASALIILGSIAFGVVRGDHTDEVVEALHDVRDSAANVAGFNITGVALTGNKHMSREE